MLIFYCAYLPSVYPLWWNFCCLLRFFFLDSNSLDSFSSCSNNQQFLGCWLLSSMSYFYFLDSTFLLDTWLSNFSPVCSLYFHSFIASPTKKSFWFRWGPIYWFFKMDCAFDCQIRELCLGLDPFSPVIFSEIIIILHFTFKSVTY